MSSFIAHRADGTTMFFEGRDTARMRKAMSSAGYRVDEMPDGLVKAAMPGLMMSDRDRASPQGRAAIAEARQRFPTASAVLAELGVTAAGSAHAHGSRQSSHETFEHVDLVANMRARVAASQPGRHRSNDDEAEPTVDLAAQMRARFEGDR